MKDIIIQTKRLFIMPRSFDELKETCDKEELEEMKQAYTEMLETMKKLKGREEWGSEWKITLKNGEVIGGICFKGEPDKQGIVEIGYGIDEIYQNNGYATEAVGAVTEWALEQKDVLWVTAQTDPDNIISQTVLFNNGFVRDGYGDEGPMFRRNKL